LIASSHRETRGRDKGRQLQRDLGAHTLSGRQCQNGDAGRPAGRPVDGPGSLTVGRPATSQCRVANNETGRVRSHMPIRDKASRPRSAKLALLIRRKRHDAELTSITPKEKRSDFIPRRLELSFGLKELSIDSTRFERRMKLSFWQGGGGGRFYHDETIWGVREVSRGARAIFFKRFSLIW